MSGKVDGVTPWSGLGGQTVLALDPSPLPVFTPQSLGSL
jgi:hypothetical protein